MPKTILYLFIGICSNVLSGQQYSDEQVAGDLNQFDYQLVYNQVDSIITNGIKNKAFPGAQVLVAKNDSIIFHEVFGYHTYDSIQPVTLDDLYDLASVTKITGPLPAIMKLVGEGKLGLDVPFSTYWKPWKRRKDKKDITLREILAHQAGLEPYIVFLNETLKKNGRFKNRFLRKSKSNRFEKQAFDSIYVKTRFNRKMYRMINRSKVSEDKTYRYSGLTFLLFPKIITDFTGVPYEQYITENFYEPICAKTLGFLPSTKNYPNLIVPTEMDTLYRHTLTQGWVHDENASLLGGISGNAGLFGTAEDLAKIMQLYLNYGAFEGKQILPKEVVQEFIMVQYPENDNRRGLGFDKPSLGNDTLALKDAYPAPEVSAESFGHSGFTGTFVWADPKNQLVYIFLSNRVFPTREHRALYDLNIRSAVQQVFYKALANQ
ncbi:serine hydrolase domain-containing protein [Maribacter sp. 4G9]|uniref:serine hydrolase domain-containing protein n=1 Tax=Maribacter sp. 4G9 TaxID=1889777 RepID=UPI000C151EF2|nr:serine hydrolase [Maribacter sp. 4G9]